MNSSTDPTDFDLHREHYSSLDFADLAKVIAKKSQLPPDAARALDHVIAEKGISPGILAR